MQAIPPKYKSWHPVNWLVVLTYIPAQWVFYFIAWIYYRRHEVKRQKD